MCLVPVASVAFLQKTRFGISNRENGAVKTQGKQTPLFPRFRGVQPTNYRTSSRLDTFVKHSMSHLCYRTPSSVLELSAGVTLEAHKSRNSMFIIVHSRWPTNFANDIAWRHD